MRIAILHNAVPFQPTPDERDVLVQRDAVRESLQRLGHTVSDMACTLNLESLKQQLLDRRPDIVFNLVEGLGGTDRLLPSVPALLEHLGIPYTGCPCSGLVLTSDKILCKHRLRQLGLPTPDWIDISDATPSLQFERSKAYIVKTIGEHASWGLDDDVVVSVTGVEELRRILDERSRRWNKPCLAEEYIDGREFNLSLLAGPNGPCVLPCAEIEFDGFPADKPRIVGYRAKWADDSFEAIHTPRTFEFGAADAPLLDELRDLAIACWTGFGLAGYARVDFRVDRRGRPWILEINANPCLSPDAGFAAALAHAGISFDAAIERMIAAAPQAHGFTAKNNAPPVATADSHRPPQDLTLRTEVNPDDRRRVREIVASTGFFTPAEVDVAVELVDERLSKGDASGYFFVFAECDGVTAGYACYGPIACTIYSFDLYWIAVDQAFQGQGIGRQLLTAAEELIKAAGGCRIYVETSSKPAYHATRTFYEHTGYRLDATVIDFYAPKDDKCIYVKVVNDDTKMAR